MRVQDALHADNLRRASELRSRASQLARDEAELLGSSVAMNLVDQPQADAAMRPGRTSPAAGSMMSLILPASGASSPDALSPASRRMIASPTSVLSPATQARLAAAAAAGAVLAAHGGVLPPPVSPTAAGSPVEEPQLQEQQHVVTDVEPGKGSGNGDEQTTATPVQPSEIMVKTPLGTAGEDIKPAQELTCGPSLVPAPPPVAPDECAGDSPPTGSCVPHVDSTDVNAS